MKKIRRLQTQGEGPRMLALEPQINLTHGLTPKRLRGILELADQGDILEQHLLFADMEDRCEHLAAEMGKRKRALLTLDWEILPGRVNDARAARIAAAVREQFDAVNGFEDLLMDLADGIGHGFSACEIEWDYRYGLHLPAAFHFRPQSWFQVLREDRNQLRLRNGKPDGEELWPFGWIVHTHRSRSGWLPRCGLFRTVAWAYLIRSYALEANIRYVQVHGLPFRLGKYPPGSREEDRRALYNALRTLGQDAAGIIPQGMDILFETPASSSQDLAGALISRCELGMSKAIRSTRPAAYISCLGAVLAPVGLIDKSQQKAKGMTVVSGTNYTFVSVAVLVLGVILSIAMAATSVTRYLGNVAQNVYLQNRAQELQPAQAVYNDYLAAEAQYDKYTYLYAYTQTPNENLVEFINELEQILPDSFYTNSFSSDQTGISMSVTVEGKAAAARTILNIRNMKSIDDVEISNITDSKDETGKSAVTFSITGSYKDLTDETEESGEAQADTQTAQ